jgi:ATP adenylyltransferase
MIQIGTLLTSHRLDEGGADSLPLSRFSEHLAMDHLWAPWRLSYVTAAKPPTTEPEPCFLCTGLAARDDRQNLIALRTPLSAVVLNRFPYNNGHLLIAPRAHKATLDDLTAEEMQDSMETVRKAIRALDEVMHPDGYNVGLNLGKAAGAGLPGHLHWHVVPRWNGDTNFMPVLADAKVIVQALDALYDLLVAKW